MIIMLISCLWKFALPHILKESGVRVVLGVRFAVIGFILKFKIQRIAIG